MPADLTTRALIALAVLAYPLALAALLILIERD